MIMENKSCNLRISGKLQEPTNILGYTVQCTLYRAQILKLVKEPRNRFQGVGRTSPSPH
jgi:hypothetical protein